MAGVFTEAWGVAVRVDQPNPPPAGPATSAVIVGGGTIGLVQGIAAKATGFVLDPVILLGTRDNRLDLVDGSRGGRRGG